MILSPLGGVFIKMAKENKFLEVAGGTQDQEGKQGVEWGQPSKNDGASQRVSWLLKPSRHEQDTPQFFICLDQSERSPRLVCDQTSSSLKQQSP